MKELVEVIAKSLVENPDEVVVTQTESGNDLLIELKVAPSDICLLYTSRCVYETGAGTGSRTGCHEWPESRTDGY